MKRIKSFEEYLKIGIVKRITADIQRAESLILESERKHTLLPTMIDKMGIGDNNANDYIEYCYNILIFLIRAKMLKQGFTSSGQTAHEAEISFGKNIGLSEAELEFLDQLRYFRNGVLYYGKRIDKEYAQKILSFTEKMYTRLK